MVREIRVSDWQEYHAVKDCVIGYLETAYTVDVALTRVSSMVLDHLEGDGLIKVDRCVRGDREAVVTKVIQYSK